LENSFEATDNNHLSFWSQNQNGAGAAGIRLIKGRSYIPDTDTHGIPSR